MNDSRQPEGTGYKDIKNYDPGYPGVKYKSVQNLICLNFRFLGCVGFPLSNATLQQISVCRKVRKLDGWKMMECVSVSRKC